MTYFTSRRTGNIRSGSMVRGRFGNLPSNKELALCWQQFSRRHNNLMKLYPAAYAGVFSDDPGLWG
jgi:hypothetical protein